MTPVKQTLLFERVMDESRLAVIEDSRLVELQIQRPDSENLTGNIYLGRVENVLAGLNAAFVDIGMDKNGFLAAGDIGVDVRGEGTLSEVLNRKRIERQVRPGQAILVQAIKSQPGGKGPRLSSHITLPGRLLVLLTDVPYVGVSKKITGDAERQRLHCIGAALMAEGGAGLILRTAAEGAGEAEIASEYAGLCALWKALQGRAAHITPPRRMHDDNDLALRAVRDRLGEKVDALWVDGEESFGELCELARNLAPAWLERIRLHDSATPLFDLYRVDAQAEKALQKYVWLKGGGSLVIEETEALTVVDVNTGKNTGKRDAEATIFENNCEAAREIMRQLRLRDIGGIVVVDFIDMKSPSRQEALLEVLRECAAQDSVRTNVVGITPLGLVELTRKKARQSLSRQLLHTCSECGGNGTVPSHETTARRALREIWRRRRAGEANPILVEANAPVCGRLKAIGVPEGGDVYLRAVADAAAGEYRLMPADVARLPEQAVRLRGAAPRDRAGGGDMKNSK